MYIAVLNAGSGTIKSACVEVGPGATVVHERFTHEFSPGQSPVGVFRRALESLDPSHPRFEAVAHRVVHGGDRFVDPVEIDAEVEEAIGALGHFAPLHNPLAMTGFRVARDRIPACPMVAVFDTAFHSDRSPASVEYALPREICQSLGLRRYGFHGIAHASLLAALAEHEGSRVEEVTAVTLQLGAGCSACAIERGRSVETSMGFSPLGGLPMATRPGDLDPGVVVALMRQGMAAPDIEHLLNHESGLLGMSGTADMREVLRAEAAGAERAGVAVDLFVRRVVATVGAYFTLLGGEGALVFGGGIGRGSGEVRARIAASLGAWTVHLDEARNHVGHPGRISLSSSRPVYVLETDEERLIAEAAYRLLHGGNES